MEMVGIDTIFDRHDDDLDVKINHFKLYFFCMYKINKL